MMLWTQNSDYFEHISSFNHHSFNKHNLVLFTRCLFFGSRPCFHASHQGEVSIHSYNLLIFLLSFDINGICFFQNPLPPKELHFIHNPLTSQKKTFEQDFKWFTKLTFCQIRMRDSPTCTPTNLWVAKYKYDENTYFLFV